MMVWDGDLAKGGLRFAANTRALFGVTMEELARPWELLHPDDVPPIKNACNQAIAERGEFKAIVRIIHPQNGGIFWSDIRGKVLCDKTNQPFAIRGAAFDVTDLKRAEEKLQEADRRKDEFLAMLAHELRNPLAPVSSATQVLSVTEHDEGQVKRVGEIIGRQAGHMTALVDDLLNAARVARGYPSTSAPSTSKASYPTRSSRSGPWSKDVFFI
jgi:PAS domain S-box-containing protein